MEETDAIQLGAQIAVSAGMVLFMTILHSLGLVGISSILNLNKDRLEEHDFNWRAILLLGSVGLLIFTLHIVEIWIFAAVYLMLDTMQTLEEALYYSASAYATLGRTAEYFPQEWRLLGAVEALIGFVLISWSAAYVATTMNRLRR